MTTPIAAPNNDRSTHHLVLTKGTDVLGLLLCDSNGNPNPNAFRPQTLNRTSIQTHSGRTRYSDLKLPWTESVQDDWSNGFGNKYFDKDSSAYGYGVGMDTTIPGQVIAAGMQVYGTGVRNVNQNWPATKERDISQLKTTTRYYAKSFVATASEKLTKIRLVLRRVGTALYYLYVSIYSDNAGQPGSLVGLQGTLDSNFINEYFSDHFIDIDATVTAGTTYWVVVMYTGTATDYIEILCDYYDTGSERLLSNDGTTWTITPRGLFFRAYADWTPATYHPVIYKGSLYLFADYGGAATPKVFRNGDQGVATGGSTTTLDDTTKNWTTDRWASAIVIFRAGAGSAQKKNWSVIRSNTSTQLIFDPINIAAAAGTEYSIVATDYFTEIAGHGLTSGPITDVLEANGAVYICQGDGINVRRMRWYTSGGAWTAQWADEGYPATFMLAGTDGVGNCIWKANRGYPAKIARAPAVDCTGSGAANALSFAADINIGNAQERITGLDLYNYGRLYVLKEGSIWEVENSKPSVIDIRELNSASDYRNGVAHLVNQLYLWFSYANGLERWYQYQIDGMGVEKTDGGYKTLGIGEYLHLAGIPGRIIACYGSDYTYGKLLMYNYAGRDGVGWCNLTKALDTDSNDNLEIINKGLYQAIPGNNVDRFWFSQGADICWISIAENPFGFMGYYNDNRFIFNPTGYIETSWFEEGFHDIDKFWKSVWLEVEHYWSAAISYWEFQIEYDIDDGNGWQMLDTKVKTQGRTEIPLSATNDICSQRIRFRIHLVNLDYNMSPRITAMGVKSLLRIPIVWGVSAYVRIADRDTDLLGNTDIDADTKLALLEKFSDSPQPVLVSSVSRELHGKYMVVEPVEKIPRTNVMDDNHTGEGNAETRIYQITLYEVD